MRSEKEDLKEANERLQADAARKDNVIEKLEEAKVWHEMLLQEICKGEYCNEILHRVHRRGENQDEVAAWLHQNLPPPVTYNTFRFDIQSLRKALAIFEMDCQARSELQSVETAVPSQEPWTNVSQDRRLIVHLLDLYFAYVHPVFMLFDEVSFMRDFNNGGHTHCSKPLLNVICAMACFVYDIELSCFETSVLEQQAAIGSLRHAFVRESIMASQYPAENPLTTVQTFAVMYLVDLCSGKAKLAIGYLKGALTGIYAIKISAQADNTKQITLMGLQTLKM